MLGGKGVFRGSSILISGSPGTGKSSISAHFIDAACRRGERAVIFAYEESAAQILRKMRSVGLDLERWMKAGLLQMRSSRPTLQGLEQHLVTALFFSQGGLGIGRYLVKRLVKMHDGTIEARSEGPGTGS